MTGETIKTLAEYIVKLNQAQERLDRFKEYSRHQFDTNGVEVDHVEDIPGTDIRSGASQ